MVSLIDVIFDNLLNKDADKIPFRDEPADWFYNTHNIAVKKHLKHIDDMKDVRENYAVMICKIRRQAFKTGFARGKKLPQEIVNALFDSTVIKTAYNASFEITCISKYIGRELPAEQWRCTSVQALELGLPRSLAETAAVLGTAEQKDKTGRALIEYFSKPIKQKHTLYDGQTTLFENCGNTAYRHTPEDDPGKWEMFKKYCVRDVETERAIKRRIAKYPIADREQRLFETDLRIDMNFVTNAVRFTENHKNICLAEAARLTGLENPKSKAQLKKWLEDETGEHVPELTKETIPELVSRFNSAKIRRVLELHLMLTKSSVAKYEANEIHTA